MTLERLHHFLVIAGAAAVPAITAAAWITIYSPWLGIDDQFITEPKGLNAVQFALATCGAIETAALCLWAADNIRPVIFMRRGSVTWFLTLAIACACFGIVLALIELIVTYQTHGGEGWVVIVGYSLWSAFSTLAFLPLLLFARVQMRLRSQNAPLSGNAIGSIFK